MSKLKVAASVPPDLVIFIAMVRGSLTTPSESTNARPWYTPSGIVPILARICASARRFNSATA